VIARPQVALVALLGAAPACHFDLQDEEPGTDPSCHFDCFDDHECVDGVVTSWRGEPIACDDWEGACPSYVGYTCERGCRIDIEEIDYVVADAQFLCEEYRPKHAGDLCTEEAHCHPQVATWNPDGTITNVYLTCDVSAGVCVDREPPVIPDFLQPCGIEAPIDPLGSYTSGVLETSLCTAGVCVYWEDPSETCVWQGCTAVCDSDDDCPPGTYCGQSPWPPTCQPPDFFAAGITCQP
jgi:hypothetical protein